MFSIHGRDTKQKEESGFTLIEVLVVSLLVAVLSGVLVFNFRSGNADERKITRQQLLFLSAVRRAQSMAIASIDLDENAGQFGGCGYGIRFVDATTFAIYRGTDRFGATPNACMDARHNFDDGVEGDRDVCPSGFNCNTDNTISLHEEGIRFCKPGMAGPNCSGGDQFTEFFFMAPDPKIFVRELGGNLATFPGHIATEEIVICVEDTNPLVCRTIEINTTGQIDLN